MKKVSKTMRENVLVFIRNNMRLPDYMYDSDPIEKEYRDAFESLHENDEAFRKHVVLWLLERS